MNKNKNNHYCGVTDYPETFKKKNIKTSGKFLDTIILYKK